MFLFQNILDLFLLGEQAVVVFIYTKRKLIRIFGPKEDVLFAAVAKIKEKKNHAKREFSIINLWMNGIKQNPKPYFFNRIKRNY